MAKYRIKVESMNPEFPMGDDRFTNGIECDGFSILTFDNEERPDAVCLHEVNLTMLAYAIANSDQLSQASALAEGILKARERKEKSGTEHMNRLSSLLSSLGGHGGLGGFTGIGGLGGSDDE